MVRRRGPRLTLAEKTELWRRWRRGESLNAIGRALGRIAHVVRYEVARTDGIPRWCATDLARYTQAQLDAIARELNTRPRKTLGYRTLADILAETVASTG